MSINFRVTGMTRPGGREESLLSLWELFSYKFDLVPVGASLYGNFLVVFVGVSLHGNLLLYLLTFQQAPINN